jgi:LysM repeat protein
VKTLSIIIVLALCFTVYSYRDQIFTSTNNDNPVQNNNKPEPVKKDPPNVVNTVKTVDEYLDSGEFSEALKLLEKEENKTPQWMRKKIETLDGLGRREEALTLMKELLPRTKKGKLPEILWLKASILKDEGDDDKAGEVYYDIISNHPSSEMALDTAIVLSKLWAPWLKMSGKVEGLPKLNKALAYIVENTLDEKLKQNTYTQLNLVNARLFFSSYTFDGIVKFHKVEHGDYLSGIAKRNKIYSERIARTNGLKRMNDIKVGQELRLIQGRANIVVSKSNFTLHLYVGGLFFKNYKIGLGKDEKTPVMQTTLSKSRAKKPTYTTPDGQLLENEDKNNPIGSRWLGFDIGRGLGIHGTREPHSIGKNMSNGCVRMLNAQVEELYDYAMVGDTVVINP